MGGGSTSCTRLWRGPLGLVALGLSLAASPARADDRVAKPVRATWGAPVPSAPRPTSTPAPFTESAAARARELIDQARRLDEAAGSDERGATDLARRLPLLRRAAEDAQMKARRAPQDIAAQARAEALAADVVISEAELAARRKAAADARAAARSLRARALALVERSPQAPHAVASCDPPFRFTAAGRKTYLRECLY